MTGETFRCLHERISDPLLTVLTIMLAVLLFVVAPLQVAGAGYYVGFVFLSVLILAAFMVSGSRVAVGMILVAIALIIVAMAIEFQRPSVVENYLDAIAWLIAGFTLSLSLAYSGGMSEGIFHSVPDLVRNFYTVSAWPGHERNLMVPDFAADRCDRVAEGQDRFWIPCGSSGLELLRFIEIVCPECCD